MNFRVSPIWWPVMLIFAPILVPIAVFKNIKYKQNIKKAETHNKRIYEKANKMSVPEIDSLEIKILVEWYKNDRFKGDAGVSYYLETEKNNILFDISHGNDSDVLEHNYELLKDDIEPIESIAISHLHNDHMGGFENFKNNIVNIPKFIDCKKDIEIFVPDKSSSNITSTEIVNKPLKINDSFLSTGTLSRSLFLLGETKEQAIVTKLRDKGIVIITGCGHQGIGKLIKLVKKITDEPIYALAGGMHFPLTNGRGNKFGFRLQTFFGTGKPPWKKLKEKDLDKVIKDINDEKIQKVYLSAHDSCDYSLHKFIEKLNGETYILKSGDCIKL